MRRGIAGPARDLATQAGQNAAPAWREEARKKWPCIQTAGVKKGMPNCALRSDPVFRLLMAK